MDIFFLQLVILFIPGIIWERIDNRFGINRPDAQFDIIRRSFCFGLTSYIFLLLFVAAFNAGAHALNPSRPEPFHLTMVNFAKDVYTLNDAIFIEIGFASLISLVLSLFWLYVTKNKYPVRFMQWIGATKRFGDEDVWDFIFNSTRAEVEYVHVRDFKNKLTYSDWVELFSETGGVRELVLRSVVVTALDGSNSYETPRLYISRATDDITIEFPYMLSKGEEPQNEPEKGYSEQPPTGV